MASPARETALRCLLACEKQGAWPDGYLRNALRKAALSSRDAALCTRLTCGTLQNRMLLDWHLNRLSSVPTARMEPAVRGCLRLGLYQILFLERVPVHAAVSESVALARQFSRSPKTPGLVNAVLRAADRAKRDGLPEPEALSIRYSHPAWMVKAFSQILPPDEVESLLAANNVQPSMSAQVNTQKVTARALAEELIAAGVSVTPHVWLPDCLELADTGPVETLPAFQEGRFYIQDAAAKLSVVAANPEPGMNVLDACAAPGGKSFAAALQMRGKGSVLSCDIHPHKRRLIEEGAARLGLSNIAAAVMDAKVFAPAWEGAFDLVIADVPCSGLGTIRKKPDIREKDPTQLEALPRVQWAILENVSRYVRSGGVLLYATCTLLPRENEDVVAAFLRTRKDFHLEPVCLPGPLGKSKGMLTLWPHRHGTDGFFFAKLRRI